NKKIKFKSLFVKFYINKNDHRESDLYNRFHQRNREIILCVIPSRYNNSKFLTKSKIIVIRKQRIPS
ncbi:MAG: hypothetical protein ACI8YQ_004997, partial [Polaribacter sp.]